MVTLPIGLLDLKSLIGSDVAMFVLGGAIRHYSPTCLVHLHHKLTKVGPALGVLTEKVMAEDKRFEAVLVIISLNGCCIALHAALPVLLDVPSHIEALRSV
jgi:hypothetical protein